MTQAPAESSHGGHALVRDCRVVELRHYGEFTRIVLAAPEIAERSRPGQFLMVAVPAPGFHLRRPLSVHRVESDRLSLLLETRGEGTALLMAARIGDTLTVTGPLGSGFPTAGVRRAVLVGGGMGAAPLQYLADALQRDGVEVSGAFGFRAARQARLANAFEIEPLWLATEDGSLGSRGTVIDLLRHMPVNESCVLFACGPLGMLAALQQWARDNRIRGFASLEARMACGTGECQGCVTPTRSGYARVCAEGPVFPLEDVVFP